MHLCARLSFSEVGHHRGHAEPFVDVMGIAPAQAMEMLEQELNALFAPIFAHMPTPRTSGVLEIEEFSGRLPDPTADTAHRNGSHARVLGAPFDGYTLMALRVIDDIAQLLFTGQGPGHRGANLLLNLVVTNWIQLSDAKIIWGQKASFFEVSSGCAVAVWIRPNCRPEIRVPLTPPAHLALGDLDINTSLQWERDTSEVANWLKKLLPNLSWAEQGPTVMAQLDALMARWLRFKLPPFALAAASPKLTCPTISRPVFARMTTPNATAAPDGEVLIFPRPKPRGTSNLRRTNSALQDIISLVHDYASQSPRPRYQSALRFFKSP